MARQPATSARLAQPPKAAAKRPGKPTPAATAATKPALKAARVADPNTPAENTTLKTLFEQLAAAQDIPKWQAHAMAAGLVDLVTGILANGGHVRMTGLGIIDVKDRAARTGRNPITGALVQIPAGKKVVFRPSKALQEVISP